MSQDFFGYSRDVKPNGQVASSEFATISVSGGGGGGSKMALVQQVQAVYTQQVNAKFEVGSPTLYWVTGQPQGTVTFGRLVGRGGFLSAFGALRNSCGSVVGVKIGLDGNGGCSAVQNGGGAGLSFTGGVPESVNVNFQAGLLEIQEGATIRVASMSA